MTANKTSNEINIIEAIGTEAMYAQLAEEAAELAQAALKVVRIYHGTNPTPVTIDEALHMVEEEYTDVIQCATYLSLTPNYMQMADKEDRWANRISEHMNMQKDTTM